MSTPIQAEWLFPVASSEDVSITGAWTLGWVALRVWATDRDYWTATDDSNGLQPQPRSGYEYEPLTYTFTCLAGRFDNGQRQQTVTLQSGGQAVVSWWSLMPGGMPLPIGATDFVTVTINDANLPGRDDSQVSLGKSIGVVGAYTTRDIALATYPATSGYGWPPDQAQRADLSVTAVGPEVQQMSAVTEFGSASGTSNTVYIPIPTNQEHRMYSVGVTATRTYGGPPGGPPGTDQKSARFGVYFHHNTFDENTDPARNWFEHWQSLIGMQQMSYRENLQIPSQPPVGVRGLHDWTGQYGARGITYIGENDTIPWHAYYSDTGGLSLGPPPGGGNDIMEGSGMDWAAMISAHEREHARFWALQYNWGPNYTQAEIGGPPPAGTAFWPYNPSSGYDNDGDGIKNEYEWEHGWDPRDQTSKGPYHWLNPFSLNQAHNGRNTQPDEEFEAVWFAERNWVLGSQVPNDWSHMGLQRSRY